MRALIAIALGLAAAGCERAAADRAQTQLVARVNGVEIAARELRAAGAASMAQAVEKVIDRELLVQKALQGRTLQLFLWAEGVTALGAGFWGLQERIKRSKAIPSVDRVSVTKWLVGSDRAVYER